MKKDFKTCFKIFYSCRNGIQKQKFLNKRSNSLKGKNCAKRKFKCPECPQKFTHKISIKAHLITHKPQNEWPFCCQFCQKRSQKSNDMLKHYLSKYHENDRPEINTPEFEDLMRRSKVYVPDISENGKKFNKIIEISIKSKENDYHFNVDVTKNLGNLKKTYAKKIGENPYNLQFVHDGRKVKVRLTYFNSFANT